AVKVLAAMAIMPPHHHEQAHQSGDRHHDGGMPRNRAAVTLEEQALRRALHTAPVPDTCAPESGGGLVDQLSAALVRGADQACHLTNGYRPVPGGSRRGAPPSRNAPREACHVAKNCRRDTAARGPPSAIERNRSRGGPLDEDQSLWSGGDNEPGSSRRHFHG